MGDTKSRALILNSRQNLRPCGDDLWIINSRLAVEEAASKGYSLLASVGIGSWEICLYCGSRLGVSMEIVVPNEKQLDNSKLKEYYISQFRLSDSRITWHFVTGSQTETAEIIRDRYLINAAEIIYPVSIRPNGNLAKLLDFRREDFPAVDNKYRIGYNQPKKYYKYHLEISRINPQIDNLLDNYLIHWTRTSNNPWPGESWYEYYESIVQSGEDYSHTAFRTLKRIISEKILRASSRHYRRGISAAAFSSLRPTEAAALMRWRARYREMAFEPYGVAIRKDYADMIGIREVIYGAAKSGDALSAELRPYFQSAGTKGYWVPEKEFRHIGDVDLKSIPDKNLIAVVWKREEIGEIQKVYDGRIISFYD
jgi:hypothetical protein